MHFSKQIHFPITSNTAKIKILKIEDWHRQKNSQLFRCSIWLTLAQLGKLWTTALKMFTQTKLIMFSLLKWPTIEIPDMEDRRIYYALSR